MTPTHLFNTGDPEGTFCRITTSNSSSRHEVRGIVTFLRSGSGSGYDHDHDCDHDQRLRLTGLYTSVALVFFSGSNMRR